MTENKPKQYEISNDYTDVEILQGLSKLPQYDRRVLMDTYNFDIIRTAVLSNEAYKDCMQTLRGNIASMQDQIRGSEIILDTFQYLREILAQDNKRGDK